MATTTKDDIIRAVAEKVGLTLPQAKQAVETMISSITAALVAGDKVQIKGLMTLKPVDKAARVGRNPRTGEAVEIPAKRAVKFQPGKALLDRLNG